MTDSANENDELGKSLAVGDFDGNSVDDLAIGAPGAATRRSGRRSSREGGVVEQRRVRYLPI
jgi:hypothetical protein